MGGVVKVTSQENVGSVFSIIFSFLCKLGSKPQSAVPHDFNVFESKMSRKLEVLDQDQSEKPKLLFVNDDEFLLFTYKEQL